MVVVCASQENRKNPQHLRVNAMSAVLIHPCAGRNCACLSVGGFSGVSCKVALSTLTLCTGFNNFGICEGLGQLYLSIF